MLPRYVCICINVWREITLAKLPVSINTLQTSQAPMPTSTTRGSLCGMWIPIVSSAKKVIGTLKQRFLVAVVARGGPSAKLALIRVPVSGFCRQSEEKRSFGKGNE
ncbi:hypothetical protein Bca101_058598 [Brassica carinata]